MQGAFLGMIAETPIHTGTGQGFGVVDLPVARERHTDHPYIPSSGLKGALRQAAVERWGVDDARVTQAFGRSDDAGDLIVCDARLVALPIRSLTTAYLWLTCRLLVEGLRRQLDRLGVEPKLAVPDDVNTGEIRAAFEGPIYLEERRFEVVGAASEDVLSAVESLISHAEPRQRVRGQLAMVSDAEFTWFARNALPVAAHNQLDPETKESKNLWYEETLPPDTVMCSSIFDRASSLEVLDELIPADAPYLRVGGNETVGQGWMGVSVRRSRGGDEADRRAERSVGAG